MIVPGALDQLTGGYLFDRRVVDGLRASGREVQVIELAGSYPQADAVACAAAVQALRTLPDGAVAVIDGLALPGFDDCLAKEAGRLRLLGFIHHPLSLESGVAPAVAGRLAALEHRLWPMLRGVLCPSTHTARCIADAGLASVRIAITPPGNDRAAADGKSDESGPVPVRDDPARPLQLLSVGSIVPRKGHRLLVEALAGLKSLPWRLTCIGSLERDRAEVAALRVAIADHQLDDRVLLAGEMQPRGLQAAWRDADVFVLPSRHEGYGMAYAEAMAHGLPVIGTTAGAIPDTVPASAGLLVEADDIDALRAAIERLLVDGSLRRKLSAGALCAAAALPDWPTAVRRWADAADRLAA